MTDDQDQLAILTERAASGRALLPAEGTALRAAVQQLRDQAHAAETRITELADGCGQLSGAVHHNRRRAEAAEARVAAVRAFAEDMATWCSPHGVAAVYAERLTAVLDARPITR